MRAMRLVVGARRHAAAVWAQASTTVRIVEAPSWWTAEPAVSEDGGVHMNHPYRQPPPSVLKFIQISCDNNRLFGLDADGQVWWYYTADADDDDTWTSGWVCKGMEPAHKK
jgi:hypothetical protein